MRIYSDTITRADLFAALPDDVGAEVITIGRPRKRRHGYIVSLNGTGARHNRRKNSGNYGASEPGTFAATWDDHGVWMDRLFQRDPDALIANYDGRDDFCEQTTKYRDEWVRPFHKPTSVRYREHMAPWLDRVEV